MSNFDSNLRECFGFSQIMLSEFFKVSIARKLISPKFPIGVEIKYRPFFIIAFLYLLIIVGSCTPLNNISTRNSNNTQSDSQQEMHDEKVETKQIISSNEKNSINEPVILENDAIIRNNITIILSKNDSFDIVSQFINVVELAVYQKKLKNISFDIKLYNNSSELDDFIKENSSPGKIFVGPLNSSDTSILKKYCNEGVIFFSFSSNKELAHDCIYLVNFFPENEIRTVFNYFPENSKIAFLYPENIYGFGINETIDQIAEQSNSVIVNRTSYNENLTNAAEAIKELGKYELRKYELDRQKKILATRNDDKSKKRLIKLERFQTTQDYDFTHVLIADYGLRLLQVAPLLAYYDIDPNIVKFVGTGAWDDKVFYDEPTLNGSIYPGIEFEKRKELTENYYNLYGETLLRTSTLPFDLIGLLTYVIDNNFTISLLYKLLNEDNTKFSGIDGSFYFLNNAIERDLSILKIEEGKAVVVSK